MKCPGGYQMVDISGVTLGAQAVTFTNAKSAEILRKTLKPVIFYGAKFGDSDFVAMSVSVSDTGATDGKVYNVLGAQGGYLVSTDDDNITFTPSGV